MSSRTFDPAVLAGLHRDLGSEREVTQEIIDTFLANSPELLAAARTALARNDRAALQRAAHTLRSSAATLGAMRLSELAGDAESALSAAIPSDASVRVEAMEREFSLAALAIRGWRAP